MPTWPNYYSSYDAGTSSTPTFSHLTATQVQQEYAEYIKRRERKERTIQQLWEEHQQMLDKQKQQAERQAEELREDKRKYPLFFLKEGIV